MAISYQTFKNVSAVTIGSLSVYGVTSITVEKTWAEIHASGDADTYEPIADVGTCSVRGTINTVDPTDADEADGVTGSLGATYKDAKGGADKTLAIAGVSVTGANQTVTKDQPSGGTISFIAASADGTTDPVAIS